MLERLHRNGKGFTLIELMIVIAIIAILAAIAIPNFMAARRRARISADRQQLSSYATAMEVYATDESLGDGRYPGGTGGTNLAGLITALSTVGSDGVTYAMRSARARDLGNKAGGDCASGGPATASSSNLYTLCIDSILIAGTATSYTWTSAGGAGW